MCFEFPIQTKEGFYKRLSRHWVNSYCQMPLPHIIIYWVVYYTCFLCDWFYSSTIQNSVAASLPNNVTQNICMYCAIAYWFHWTMKYVRNYITFQHKKINNWPFWGVFYLENYICPDVNLNASLWGLEYSNHRCLEVFQKG